jgi:hypothetical protein
VLVKVKVKFSLCLVKHYIMKMYGGVEIMLHTHLESQHQIELRGQFHASAAL